MSSPPTTTSGRRRLPVLAFIIIAALYLIAIHFATVPFEKGEVGYAQFRTVEDVLRGLFPTVVLGALIGIAVVSYLRWWRPVLRDEPELRAPRFVWLFPVIIVVAILGGIQYSALADKGVAFTISLLIGALLVGVSEELMFRGIGVVSLRDAGLSEGKVALYSSVIFGLAHATNLFTEGLSAIPQVLTTAVAGYFFYLTRRVSGTLILGVVLHGLWDFGLFTGLINGPDNPYIGTFLFIIADVVMLIIALATIRKVFPRREERAEVGAA